MATVHTPPIDLYDESQDPNEERWANTTPDDVQTPTDNGDLDEPAFAAGMHRLEQVLGG